MPIEVSWGNPEKTYTIFKFIGTWTWDEYYAAIHEGEQLIASIPYKVNILIDLSDCRLFPSNLLSITASSMRQPPRAFDLAIIVSETSFVRIVTNILDRLFSSKGTRFRIASTIDEAQAMFRAFDRGRTASTSNPR